MGFQAGAPLPASPGGWGAASPLRLGRSRSRCGPPAAWLWVCIPPGQSGRERLKGLVLLPRSPLSIASAPCWSSFPISIHGQPAGEERPWRSYINAKRPLQLGIRAGQGPGPPCAFSTAQGGCERDGDNDPAILLHRCVPRPLCVRVSSSHRTSLRWAFLSALVKVRKLRLREGKRGGVKEKLLKTAQQQGFLYPSLETGRGVTTPGSGQWQRPDGPTLEAKGSN